ncbi:MAG TPA: hypothetical protein VHD95_13260 [Rhizomicrobium sp.]|jgi:hypothetical protein|nr:hypothetical protein [Rhizomicrobium sp.]
MPTYDICYLNIDGSLAAKLSALCTDDKQAKILAHAMKLSGTKQIEVWEGKALVYQRPEKVS